MRPSMQLHSAGRRLARRRRGVSILEVLFAILVTTIGLLGAIAVFPVASAQARKGRMSDALAVAGMSAVHDFSVRGMDRPANWIAFTAAGANSYPYTEYQNWVSSSGSSGSEWFGGDYAFCIDPRFIAANSGSLSTAYRFPMSTVVPANPMAPDMGFPSIWRCSLASGVNNSSGQPDWLKTAAAEAMFVFGDDLTFDRPTDRTLNAGQIWDQELNSSNPTIYKRQTDGHMSWMATLVPQIDHRSYTAPNGYQGNFILSIVVFFDRPLGASDSEYVFGGTATSSVTFPGEGITGGEVLLTTGNTDAERDRLNKIRPQDWVMLAAQTTDGKPVARWYRVVDADLEATASGSGYERNLTLFGQDWNTSLSKVYCVTVDGVVGVYEKTIQLDLSQK